MRFGQRIVVGLSVALVSTLGAGTARAASEYPNRPFAVGGVPTAVVPARGGFADELGVWVVRRGAVMRLLQTPDGSMAVMETIDLPPEVVPLSVAEVWPWILVLDAAGGVLAYRGAPGPDYQLVHTLATGSQPSSMLASGGALMITNAGSDDVSLYTSFDGSAPERRVRVGSRPRALVWGVFAGGADVAVANEGSGTVTLLDTEEDLGDARDTPRVVAEPRVGGAPSALTTLHLGSRNYDDLAVADGSAPSVTLWRRARRGLSAAGSVRLAHPSSRAHALAAGDFAGDGRVDLLIADRATGVVAAAPGLPGRRFGPPAPLLSGVDPLGLLTGWNLGGDHNDDLAILDGRGQTLLRRLTPGDALVEPDPGAERLDAGAGRLVWSRRGWDGRHRVMVRFRGRTSEIPGAVSDEGVTPRMGRSRRGRPVAAYVLCRGRRCVGRLWDFRSGRALPASIRTPRRCELSDLAVWDRWRAYEYASGAGRRCPRRHRGLWIQRRGQRPRRPGSGNTELADLHGGYLAWDSWKVVDGLADPSLRLRRLGGRSSRRVVWYGVDSLRGLGITQISGRYLYWTDTSEGVGEVFRSPLTAKDMCFQELRGGLRAANGRIAGSHASVDFAVERGRLLYSDDFSIFRPKRADLRWRGRACR